MSRKRRGGDAWMRLGLDAWSLGLEASAVVALRTMKLAAGGQAALDESRRMVAEKVAAAADLQAKAMTGALGGTLPAAMSGAVRHYRRRVRANRRRLTGG